jgi:two-component system sensor histidine kinase YesM
LLTRPIKNLQQLMERTEFHNMDRAIAAKPHAASNEIEAFYESYRNLLKRLSDSIEHENESSLLQMQAQFDTLQAQINPHFIYNVLNTISQRGMELEDETICEICSGLAEILRYSTNTRSKVATLEEELDSLRRYCFLLKTRYQHRFEYTIRIDDQIKSVILPKLSLQQLIENSISHGFANSTDRMEISIVGWLDDHTARIQVKDNGIGFSADTLMQLNNKFAMIREQIRSRGKVTELEIGGLGLANTYARLYLYYGDQFEFQVSNDEGALVSLSIPLHETGSKDAYEI